MAMKQAINGRPFTPDEQHILACNGIPRSELDQMQLYGALPLPFAAANAYHNLTQPPGRASTSMA